MSKKFYIETYGCQMNVADSEVVAAILETTDAEIAEQWEEADIVILNTCSIRDNAEQKVGSRLRELNGLMAKGRKAKGERPIIGVIGCMAERMGQELIDTFGVDFVAGPDAYLDIPNLLAQCEQGHKAMNVELSTTETYRQIIPSRIGKSISGFVSIMRGCNNFCSYCVVPYTRGRERSRDVESILNEVRDLQARGYKEVTLLGQNVNSYKFGDVGFADLLEISRQTMVLAFQFGDGITNMITPASGVLIGCLGVARIPYSLWMKWIFKWILCLLLIGFLLLLPTLFIPMAGF